MFFFGNIKCYIIMNLFETINVTREQNQKNCAIVTNRHDYYCTVKLFLFWWLLLKLLLSLLLKCVSFLQPLWNGRTSVMNVRRKHKLLKMICLPYTLVMINYTGMQILLTISTFKYFQCYFKHSFNKYKLHVLMSMTITTRRLIKKWKHLF